MIFLSDAEIQQLIAAPKPLPPDYRSRLRLREKRGHRERDLTVAGPDDSTFRLILRESELNRMDFSVILTWAPKHSNEHVRLKRYNGKAHEHTNSIEGDRFYDFHIHLATERYQRIGGKDPDSFAQPTNRYASLQQALDCALLDCNFVFPGDASNQRMLEF